MLFVYYIKKPLVWLCESIRCQFSMRFSVCPTLDSVHMTLWPNHTLWCALTHMSMYSKVWTSDVWAQSSRLTWYKSDRWERRSKKSSCFDFWFDFTIFHNFSLIICEPIRGTPMMMALKRFNLEFSSISSDEKAYSTEEEAHLHCLLKVSSIVGEGKYSICE